ncbi:MAG TPA: 30S ribosomal protein S21 [Candidatus Kapabacteria bacterium]|nr:30S ribosomal protein S21 [Candidatus Kapabacteria bacterium]
MSEVKRKKGESFEGFMRRVKRQWQQSGKILQVKKIQFFESPKSKNVKRKHAVARIRKTSKLNYLRKIGKLPPDQDPLLTRKR